MYSVQNTPLSKQIGRFEFSYRDKRTKVHIQDTAKKLKNFPFILFLSIPCSSWNGMRDGLGWREGWVGMARAMGWRGNKI